MSVGQVKGIPLTKEEVMLLVNLVESNTVVTSKVTNAANNQLKESAWQRITEHFNSAINTCPRRPDQLRLKWENLKKSARKRSSRIRMNNLKTGGGKPYYIPPNEALDKVSTMLGATCDENTVPFGRDAETQADNDDDEVKEVIIHQPYNDFKVTDNSASNTGGIEDNVVIVEDVQPSTSSLTDTPKQKKIFFSSANSVEKKNCDAAKEKESNILNERNRAIADYYKAKKEKINLEIEILKRQKIKLELKIKKLGIPNL